MAELNPLLREAGQNQLRKLEETRAQMMSGVQGSDTMISQGPQQSDQASSIRDIGFEQAPQISYTPPAQISAPPVEEQPQVTPQADPDGFYPTPEAIAQANSAGVKPVKELFEGQFGITQQFGNYNPALYRNITKGSRHTGVDLATPAGTPLKSPFEGRVEMGTDKSFGNYVRIVGDDGLIFQFSHLSEISPQLQAIAREQGRITSGMDIGLTGGAKGSYGAGNSTGAHLDITLRRNGQFINPLSFEPLSRAINY